MKYIKAFGQYSKIEEAAEVNPEEVLHRIKNAPGGCSLQELLEVYPDPAQTMTILDTLTNQSAVELTGGKYRAA